MPRAAVLALRASLDDLAPNAPPEGIPPAAIARALRIGPSAQNFKLALRAAVADGGWIATGSGSSRRYPRSTKVETDADVVADDDSLPAPSCTCRHPLADGEDACAWRAVAR